MIHRYLSKHGFMAVLLLLTMWPTILHAQESIRLQYASNIDRGYGDADAVVTPYTIFTPTEVAVYAGAQITSVRIGLKAKATGVYLYIKQNPADATPLYKQKVGDLTAGWNEIELDTPFDVNGTDTISIGYKASFRQAEGAGYDKQTSECGNIIYNNARTRWDYIQGSFCIQAILTGDALPTDELAFVALHDATKAIGSETTQMTAVVENRGVNLIESYTVEVSVDEKEPFCYTFETALMSNERDTVSLELSSPGIGQHKVYAHIADVNGRTDSYEADNHREATLFEGDPSMIRRVVAEEATGEWCAWCPRGLVGMEMMKQEHPADFIAISVHGDDELAIDAYQPFLNTIEVFPSCKADRRLTGDPYEDIRRLFSEEVEATNHYGYTLTATLSTDGMVHTESRLQVDKELLQQNLNVAIVVTEDGVKGLYQMNAYNGWSEPMGGWESQPSVVSPVYFDDVARGIFPKYEGEKMIQGTLEPDKTYQHDIDFTLPDNVTDSKRIHIVGLLLDSTTGYIVNAMSTTPSIASRLEDVTDLSGSIVEAFDLLGHRLETSHDASPQQQKALRIVRDAQGQYRKVLY